VSKAYKRPESVLVVIYSVNGEVLLLERRQPAGYWQSVTGSLERGESARDASIREVREETGLQVQESLVDCAYSNRFEIIPAWRARYAPDVNWNTEHVFRVELAATDPICINTEEHVQAEWVPAQQAAKRASSHTNRTAIERYVSARII
jgi:dATP pyrophosphohydrolase